MSERLDIRPDSPACHVIIDMTHDNGSCRHTVQSGSVCRLAIADFKDLTLVERMRFSIWVIFFLLLLTEPGSAISTYVDDDGSIVFVDDVSKVPGRYLDRSQTVDWLRELTAEEKSEQAERLSNAREQRKNERDQKRRALATQEQSKLYRTPVVIRGNQVLVPVEVAYGNRTAHLNLLLDTGASRTLFHKRSLARLDIDADAGVSTHGVGVGGYRIETQMINFRSIAVGPFKAEGAPAFVIEHKNPKIGYDGLLGMDFLRFLNYEIDFSAQMIHWQP